MNIIDFISGGWRLELSDKEKFEKARIKLLTKELLDLQNKEPKVEYECLDEETNAYEQEITSRTC